MGEYGENKRSRPLERRPAIHGEYTCQNTSSFPKIINYPSFDEPEVKETECDGLVLFASCVSMGNTTTAVDMCQKRSPEMHPEKKKKKKRTNNSQEGNLASFWSQTLHV